jgi:C4-dicarboxylate-specific signal transduction histidine kinase
MNGHATASRGDHRVWNIVREGVTRFGGTLAVSNGLNGGARFRITLQTAVA